MGFCIAPKMSLKSYPVRARFGVFREQSGHRRIASIGRDKKPGLDHFVIGGDFPTRTVLNLEHRVPESDLGSRRDGMGDQSVIEKFSTDPSLSPGFIREAQIESGVLSDQGTRPSAIWQTECDQ